MHQHLKHLTQGKDPPGMTSKTSIVGRSPSGQAAIAFENTDQAKRWAEKNPNHRISWYRQTITEEQVQINI